MEASLRCCHDEKIHRETRPGARTAPDEAVREDGSPSVGRDPAPGVRNESAHAVGEVAIEIDRAYLEGFQADSFLPEPDEITPAAYVVEVGAIQAGEVRRVVLDLSAEKVGRQEGQVRVTSGGQRLAAIDLSTFVFP